MTKKQSRKFEVEDRTNLKPGIVGAGKWVVWQIKAKPFPHKLFAGMCDTEQEAKTLAAKYKRLK